MRCGVAELPAQAGAFNEGAQLDSCVLRDSPRALGHTRPRQQQPGGQRLAPTQPSGLLRRRAHRVTEGGSWGAQLLSWCPRLLKSGIGHRCQQVAPGPSLHGHRDGEVGGRRGLISARRMNDALWQIERIARLQLALYALELALITLRKVFSGVPRAAVCSMPLHLTQLALLCF